MYTEDTRNIQWFVNYTRVPPVIEVHGGPSDLDGACHHGNNLLTRIK
jgi:hypothetical protein